MKRLLCFFFFFNRNNFIKIILFFNKYEGVAEKNKEKRSERVWEGALRGREKKGVLSALFT